MPGYQTVADWKNSNPEFSVDIARAREAGYDAIAQDCLKIADETGRDTIIGENGDRPDSEWIARSRLRVETRLKLLAKWCPKRYGEKVEHEVTGGHKVVVEIGGDIT